MRKKSRAAQAIKKRRLKRPRRKTTGDSSSDEQNPDENPRGLTIDMLFIPEPPIFGVA